MFERRHSSAITVFPSIRYDLALLLRGLSLITVQTLYSCRRARVSHIDILQSRAALFFRFPAFRLALVLRGKERERVKEERTRELIKVSSRQRTNFTNFLLLMQFSLGVGE